MKVKQSRYTKAIVIMGPDSVGDAFFPDVFRMLINGECPRNRLGLFWWINKVKRDTGLEEIAFGLHEVTKYLGRARAARLVTVTLPKTSYWNILQTLTVKYFVSGATLTYVRREALTERYY